MPVVGYLGPGSAVSDAFRVTAFRQGLSEAGFVEGQNVTVDYRWAEEHYDRLPAMATDLVNRRVAVIVATSTPAALAAKAATTTVPIIFETAADPVKLGFVASLNRPGGNVTGVTQLGEEVLPKTAGVAARVASFGTRHGAPHQPCRSRSCRAPNACGPVGGQDFRAGTSCPWRQH